MKIQSRKIKKFIMQLSSYEQEAERMNMTVSELRNKIEGIKPWSNEDLVYIKKIDV